MKIILGPGVLTILGRTLRTLLSFVTQEPIPPQINATLRKATKTAKSGSQSGDKDQDRSR